MNLRQGIAILFHTYHNNSLVLDSDTWRATKLALYTDTLLPKLQRYKYTARCASLGTALGQTCANLYYIF